MNESHILTAGLIIVVGFNERQHALYLIFGSDDSQDVAGKDAHFARWHGMQFAGALDIHQVHTISSAQVKIAKSLAHKRTLVAHFHIGQMQVAHQIVLSAGSSVLTLVDVAEEPTLNSVDAFAQRGGDYQKDEQGKSYQHNGYNE